MIPRVSFRLEYQAGLSWGVKKVENRDAAIVFGFSHEEVLRHVPFQHSRLERTRSKGLPLVQEGIIL